MKKSKTLSTILIILMACLAVILFSLLGVYLTKPIKGQKDLAPVDAATPTGNWTDYATTPAIGSGTEADPWHIKSAAELAYVSKTATKESDLYVYLDANIDLGAHVWKPIGGIYEQINSIYFYGQNHTISNMYSDSNANTVSSSNEAGFIGKVITAGEIRDISFNNAQVISTKHSAAIVVKSGSNLNISNIKIVESKITVTSTSNSSISYVGGIVSSLSGEIANCSVDIHISVEKGMYVGGIVGNSLENGKVNNCSCSGTVSAEYEQVGGIVGYAQKNSIIENCVNSATVSGGRDVGGIVGRLEVNSKITNCENRGEIKGDNKYDGAGGICGVAVAKVDNTGSLIQYCINKGNIISTGSAGGIVYSGQTSKIAGCINFGNVHGEKNSYGLMRDSEKATITDSYSVSGSWADYRSSGLQKDGDTYLISSAEDFAFMAYEINNGNTTYMSANYRVIAPIDLYEHFWVPIAHENTNRFTGTITGDGLKTPIRGVFIIDEYNFTGLFGYVEGATFSNLAVETEYVESSSADVGGLVGRMHTTKRTICENVNMSKISVIATKGNAGGIAGYAFADIKNCKVNVNIKAYLSAGGIAGASYNYSKIEDCIAEGSIVGTYADNTNRPGIGGISGHSWHTTILNCVNKASVSGIGKSFIGGISGNQGILKSCTNFGYISSILADEDNGAYCGGISGLNKEAIESCINFGEIMALEGSAGGIAGRYYNEGSMKQCINLGKITADYYSAGIVGVVDSITVRVCIFDCYNEGEVYGVLSASGIVGLSQYGELAIERCYNNGSLKNNSTSNRIGGALGCINYNNADHPTSVVISNSGSIGEIISTSTHTQNGLVGTVNSNATFACLSSYYDEIIKKSETASGTRKKEYILGDGVTENDAFSSDVWLQNGKTELTSMPIPKTLVWIGEYLENNQNILQFLKNNGFTQVA